MLFKSSKPYTLSSTFRLFEMVEVPEPASLIICSINILNAELLYSWLLGGENVARGWKQGQCFKFVRYSTMVFTVQRSMPSEQRQQRPVQPRRALIPDFEIILNCSRCYNQRFNWACVLLERNKSKNKSYLSISPWQGSILANWQFVQGLIFVHDVTDENNKIELI